MTKIYFFILLIFFGTVNDFVFGQNFKKEAIEARDSKYECFVQLQDSSIIKFTKLKYKMPPMSYGYLEGDGKRLEYEAKDILAFQDKKAYWLRVKDPDGFTKPVVGKYSFDNFFAARIVNGKIELFMQYSNNGRSVLDDSYQSGRSYYIKKGKDLTGLDKWGVNLKNMMKDNKKLYNDFDDSGKAKIKDLIEVIEEYNSSK